MEEDLVFAERETDPRIYEPMHRILEDKMAALAFIAPYSPEKISPRRAISARIAIPEELGIEDAISKIKKEGIEELFLLLNSFGGDVSSSYKIARILRENFKELTIFIPHIAASGGTLIALSGTKIVMGEMSHLSPIDIQIERGGNYYSANAMIKAFGNLNDLF